MQENYLSETNKHKFKETLLLPHVHQYENEFKNNIDIGSRNKIKKPQRQSYGNGF